MPPQISVLGPWHLRPGALVHQTVCDVWALLQRLVDDLLGTDDLATALALVGGDDDLGIGVNNTIAERVRGETSKDNRVDGADTRAGEECNQSFGNHGHVESDGVALPHTHLSESVGEFADLSEELAVCYRPALAGLVCLIDDGGLVGVLDRMPVDAVVGGVQATLEEPGVVSA